MKVGFEAALAAWKATEVEAQDAYALLRIALIKHVEGIDGPPPEQLLENAMVAKLRCFASMKLVVRALRAD